MPLLSVVIPSYNRPDLLRLCLASVTRHAPAGTEILVVDDASPGGVASAVAESFPGVRRLRLPRQRGFCVAVNAGVAAAMHPVVELLNDDTEVAAGWADAALAHFQDPQVVAVAPLVLCGPPDADAVPRIDSAGDCYFVGGVASKRGHGSRLTATYLEAGPVFGASASSAFYRRDALQSIGGFPESFGAYFEDVDVSFRLNWAGFRVVYEPAARVWHRVSASYGRPRRRLLEQQARNEERVFWRNLPAALLPRALPWHAAVLLAKAWRRWHEGQLLPFCFGKLRVLGDLAELRRHRRRLHDLRPVPDWNHWRLEMSFPSLLPRHIRFALWLLSIVRFAGLGARAVRPSMASFGIGGSGARATLAHAQELCKGRILAPRDGEPRALPRTDPCNMTLQGWVGTRSVQGSVGHLPVCGPFVPTE